jgi:tetratricopeptide (TPR) repeat protein
MLMAAACLLLIGLGGGFLLGVYQGNEDIRSTEAADLRARVELQYQLALEDIAAENFERAYLRLSDVVALNPAYRDAQEQYDWVRWRLANPPTATPTATPPPTVDAVEAPTAAPPSIDADAWFADAEAAYQASDWETAIDLLDTLAGAAPDHRSDEVRAMLFDALVELGSSLLDGSERLQEGVNLIDRAAIYGAVPQAALSKRDLAADYLRAVGYLGVDWSRAIDELLILYNQVPEYRDVGRRLFSAYVGYGDSYTTRGEYCPAVPLYQSALNMIYDGEVEVRRSEAQSYCASATPTPAPTVAPTVIPGALGITVYSQANLRRGPSADQYEVLEALGGGALLSAIGRNADGTWLFVVTPSGTRGWVFVEVVNTELVDVSTLPITDELGGASQPTAEGAPQP